jgi:hypothetical protein
MHAEDGCYAKFSSSLKQNPSTQRERLENAKTEALKQLEDRQYRARAPLESTSLYSRSAGSSVLQPCVPLLGTTPGTSGNETLKNPPMVAGCMVDMTEEYEDKADMGNEDEDDGRHERWR